MLYLLFLEIFSHYEIKTMLLLIIIIIIIILLLLLLLYSASVDILYLGATNPEGFNSDTFQRYSCFLPSVKSHQWSTYKYFIHLPATPYNLSHLIVSLNKTRYAWYVKAVHLHLSVCGMCVWTMRHVHYNAFHICIYLYWHLEFTAVV